MVHGVTKSQTRLSNRAEREVLQDIKLSSATWKMGSITVPSFQPWASLAAQMVKNLPSMLETRFDPWVRKIPQRREWQPTLVFLSGEFHEKRSLAAYSLWGRKELDKTKRLNTSNPGILSQSLCLTKLTSTLPSQQVSELSPRTKAPSFHPVTLCQGTPPEALTLWSKNS